MRERQDLIERKLVRRRRVATEDYRKREIEENESERERERERMREELMSRQR